MGPDFLSRERIKDAFPQIASTLLSKAQPWDSRAVNCDDLIEAPSAASGATASYYRVGIPWHSQHLWELPCH
jgi:hypothetical protein